MKVVGVCGSPRKGNSEFMLRTVLDAAKEKGAETELILLKDFDIGFFGTDKGDFEAIVPPIKSADVLIFATPCYYDMISPQLLNVIDLLDLHAADMKNKKLGILMSGCAEYDESAKNAVEYLERVAGIYEMKVIGHVFGKSDKPDDISKDKETIKKLKEFGRKICK